MCMDFLNIQTFYPYLNPLINLTIFEFSKNFTHTITPTAKNYKI